MKITIGLLSLLISLSVSAMEIKVISANGDHLSKDNEFNGFGCSGKNLSPEIKITAVPKDAKSLAIIVFDPDAPTGGGGWYHWLAVNIPTHKTTFKVGEKDLAKLGIIQPLNSYGTNDFGGACPPVGDKAHRYIFSVYALKTAKLDVNQTTNSNIAGYYIVANQIAKAEAQLLYERK